ncbi:MAG: NAD(P)/FAD-dependent oxidoreductase [Anaerolineae bacterium]|nr:NAD(P)/FAD-dependent oxidoreductase [Anaerolineae bacterium]
MRLDAIIVGGGVAGLTAALYLGRFCRDVMLFDTGKQANRVSHAAHGFLTRDGTSPAELINIGREQLARYETVRIQSDEIIAITPSENGFIVTVDQMTSFATRKVLLATGLKDGLPPISGIELFWGKSVFHCPYCDGWERRNQPLAIINDGAPAIHTAKLLRVLTDDLVICTNGISALNAVERTALNQYGIQIIETPIDRLEGQDGQLEQMVFSDGQRLSRQGVFIRPTSIQHSALATQLGCLMTPEQFVQIDEFGRTSIAGVYAAGDLANRVRQVVMASAQGASAAIGINMDLIAEDFG